MEREQAKQEIKRSISCKDYLQKSKGGNNNCPFCGSGTGPHGTGALHFYPKTNTFTCFHCRKSGDVIDLIMQADKVDYNQALQNAAAMCGITIDEHAPQAPYGAESRKADKVNADKENTPKNATQSVAEPIVEQPEDLTAYYRACKQRLSDPAAVSYLSARGISVETAAAAYIGFDPLSDPAKSNHPTPRIIIPTSKTHYVGRRVDGVKDYAKMNNKGGVPGIFNAAALYKDNEYVFVVEGAFDALSLMEIGTAAVAINSTSNADKLIKMLEEKPTKATLVICLDNDEDPRTKEHTEKAERVLLDGLKRLNISSIKADICGKYKDPNEALTGDKKAFMAAVQKVTITKPDNVTSYIDDLMIWEINSQAKYADRKTGFDNLDKESGGLYPGLYVIAAISSLGKTTFSHQIADNLATAGHDVLFFSMEQSRLELVTKSITRTMAQKDKKAAVTSLEIRKGNLSDQVKTAAIKYKNAVGDRMNIIEGNFNCNISFIGEYIRNYVRRNESSPIVFVDYLQILQPVEDARRASIRETIDSTVTELKRLSRELNLTVFVISSVNRSNYLTPIDFESLKESGGIEYTADVIWGLQLKCLNDPVFAEEKKIKEKREKIRIAKAATPRQIELVCLKNRYGRSSYNCYFDYYSALDLYEPNYAVGFAPITGKSPFDEPAKKKA